MAIAVAIAEGKYYQSINTNLPSYCWLNARLQMCLYAFEYCNAHNLKKNIHICPEIYFIQGSIYKLACIIDLLSTKLNTYLAYTMKESRPRDLFSLIAYFFVAGISNLRSAT